MEPHGIKDFFTDIDDPRTGPAIRHLLLEIIVIAIIAVICGAASWRDIEAFAIKRRQLLAAFLTLPAGIPSHDTFGRVFARLDPASFQRCFLAWIEALFQLGRGKFVAIDGKTLRRSFDKAAGLGPLHLVAAWSVENKLVLGQLRVAAKSNEITAIPQLLELLNLSRCTVTIDAIGCQTEIARKIVEKEGDYVLAIKGNQPTLHDAIRLQFDGASPEMLDKKLGTSVQTTEKGHGRVEVRQYWQASNVDFLQGEADRWTGFKAVGIVDRETWRGETRTAERRYFLLSFAEDTARFATAARSHWAIENTLHWSMDVTFDEDRSRVRKGHAPENMALLRRAALTLTEQVARIDAANSPPGKEKRFSVHTRRLMSGWDEGFLRRILTGSPEALASGEHQ